MSLIKPISMTMPNSIVGWKKQYCVLIKDHYEGEKQCRLFPMAPIPLPGVSERISYSTDDSPYGRSTYWVVSDDEEVEVLSEPAASQI